MLGRQRSVQFTSLVHCRGARRPVDPFSSEMWRNSRLSWSALRGLSAETALCKGHRLPDGLCELRERGNGGIRATCTDVGNCRYEASDEGFFTSHRIAGFGVPLAKRLATRARSENPLDHGVRSSSHVPYSACWRSSSVTSLLTYSPDSCPACVQDQYTQSVHSPAPSCTS